MDLQGSNVEGDPVVDNVFFFETTGCRESSGKLVVVSNRRNKARVAVVATLADERTLNM